MAGDLLMKKYIAFLFLLLLFSTSLLPAQTFGNIPVAGNIPRMGIAGPQDIDTFTGSNGTSLVGGSHTSNSGHTWATWAANTSGAGVLKLNGSGEVTDTTGTGFGAALNSLTPSSADYTVSCIGTILVSGGRVTIVARGVSDGGAHPGDAIYMEYDPLNLGGVKVYQILLGVLTQIGSSYSNVTWGPHTIVLKVAGTVATAYFDGTSIISGTIGLAAAGQAGIQLNYGTVAQSKASSWMVQ